MQIQELVRFPMLVTHKCKQKKTNFLFAIPGTDAGHTMFVSPLHNLLMFLKCSWMSENSADPHQMQCLIWVYTVCWSLSVPILWGFGYHIVCTNPVRISQSQISSVPTQLIKEMARKFTERVQWLSFLFVFYCFCKNLGSHIGLHVLTARNHVYAVHRCDLVPNFQCAHTAY